MGCVGGRPFLTAFLARRLASSKRDHLTHKLRIERLATPDSSRGLLRLVRESSLRGALVRKPRELEVIAHAKRHATSGVCPSCFAELNQEPPS
jgi:hypothetical protein